MKKLKIFVVGPHDEARYKLIRDYIRSYVSRTEYAGDVQIATPVDNPTADRFNDWIFGQIDTCDLIVADLTGFNPNVVYEVAFAHTLGTPCVYLRFKDEKTDTSAIESISHYFKLTLMPQTDAATLIPAVDADDMSAGAIPHLDRYLSLFLGFGAGGVQVSGETILSDYYGAFPADSEFMRGLADGYYRNFLSYILEADRDSDDDFRDIKIIIPDTFEVTDADIDRQVRALSTSFDEYEGAENSLNRTLRVRKFVSQKDEFYYDIPSTILTVTLSSKYKKIKSAGYFSLEERDRITDRLARKFVESIWMAIQGDLRSIKFPLRRLQFVWLSEVVGQWHDNPRLMNDVPFDRPDGY
ncbi:nucleoside 2-deoxyribosyltransferase [Heliomarina baculiformis]|uniref:nucleoside 2-deoxyribosyltransferase n=1 Tax=Heliomarina baculiformis TaxID=2872036 RepID=UPI001EE28589|nr:nucleoside 2-deoxyribosyltransferase [Heliomarina baculiformis]